MEEDEDRYARITLRIPKTLHKRLSDEADRTSKSLNAEIVGRLEESFADLKPNGALVTLAVKLAETDEARLAEAIKAEGILYSGSLVSVHLMDALNTAKELGVQLLPDETEKAAYAGAYKLYHQAEQSLKAERFQKLVREADVAVERVKEAIEARNLAVHGRPQVPPAVPRPGLIRRPPPKPKKP